MLIKEKVNQAISILREFDIDCWITFVRESQLNGDPILPFLVDADVTWHSAFIISKSGKSAAIVGRYDKATIEELEVYDVVTGFVEGIKVPFQKYIADINPKQIAINYSEGSEICDGITHGMYLILKKLLNEIGFGNRLLTAEKIVSALRQRKTETELTAIKDAIRHTEEIFDSAADFIKPGTTEIEIAEFIKAEVKKRKLDFAWEPKVCPAVFTGPEGAEAHYSPTSKKVERGHVLNMDFGVKVNGYCSDMQRTFYILNKDESNAPEDVMKGFNTIVKAIEKSKQAIKPGAKGIEIDKIARDTVVNSGYKEFPHGLGHQVGRFSHDGTALLGPPWEKYAQKPFETLEPGMVFTIEPRLTIENRGVATIEEMVLINEKGCEWLSHPQKEIILIK